MIMFVFRVLFFVFFSYTACLATGKEEEFGERYFCTNARVMEYSSSELKDLVNSGKYYHNYFSTCYKKNDGWVEKKETSYGFHATKEIDFQKPDFLETKRSGFQNEKNTINSKILSKIPDKDGLIYEQVMKETIKFENKKFHLFNKNCGTRLGQAISKSPLNKSTKEVILNYDFCVKNMGIGKEKIPECTKHIQNFREGLPPLI